MALHKQRYDDLPDGEKEFIAAVQDLAVPDYAAGFSVEQRLQEFVNHYFSYLNQYSDLALLRIGSSGRYEGFALGEAEFVLVVRPGHGGSPQHVKLDELLVLLRRPLPIPYQEWETKSSVEVKDLSTDIPFSFYGGNSKGKPFPGRVLEAEFVAGNPDLFWEARRRVLQEVTSEKAIRRALRDMRREHRSICESGIQRYKGEELRQLDIHRGIVFHDPERNLDGLKRSFLRYVQTGLSYEIFDLLARKGIAVADVLDLNQSVEERIRYCFRKGWVKNKTGLIDVGCAYIELTALQGNIKWAYLTNKRKEFQLKESSQLRRAYELIVPTMEAGVLIE